MLLNDYIESLKKIISNLTTGGLNVTFRDYLFAAIGTFLLLCAIIALVVAVYFLILGPRKAYKKYMGILLDNYKELQLKIGKESDKHYKDRDDNKINTFEKELTPLRKKVRKKRTIFFTALSLIYVPILLPLILIILSLIPHMVLITIGIIIGIIIILIILVFLLDY